MSRPRGPTTRAKRTAAGTAGDRSCGFALVEILCALLILGFGLVGLTEAITYALRMSKESEYQTQAALLAAGRLEEIRADTFLVEGSSEGTFTGVFAHLAWAEEIAETSTEGLYRVTIEISLADGGAPVYELDTLLFDPPFTSTFGDTRSLTDSRLDKVRRSKGLTGAAEAKEGSR